jgi:superfamily II DNA or RNA helicase
METVTVSKVNDVYIKCDCEASTSQELTDYFTFDVPNAKFHPLYRNKVWDGKIRVFNYMTRQVYTGLLPYVAAFCESRDYKLEIADDLHPKERYEDDYGYRLATKYEAKFELRDYQNEAVVHGLNKTRSLMVCPTASGKSFIIYLLTRYHLEQERRVLIIVPTTSLVQQMRSDFVEYNNNQAMDIHMIMAGAEKDIENKIVISTWQSLYKLKKDWFKKFDVVVGDEAHLFKAKSLTAIMTKLIECPYRYGFTGTLDGTQTNKLVLEGLFGAAKQITTTATLMENKILADLNIKAIVLKYPEEVCKINKTRDYQNEIDFIVRNDIRNKFIETLALELKGNTLLLFQFVDKHGVQLYNSLETTGRRVFFVHGGVKSEEREDIRRIVEKEENAIIIASYGTFSTGVNIRNLHNIIFSSPSKSRIRNLQSIGRGLRMSSTKKRVTLYDIVDDLSYKNYQNYALKHFMERADIYSKEGFKYKLYSVKLGE